MRKTGQSPPLTQLSLLNPSPQECKKEKKVKANCVGVFLLRKALPLWALSIVEEQKLKIKYTGEITDLWFAMAWAHGPGMTLCPALGPTPLPTEEGQSHPRKSRTSLSSVLLCSSPYSIPPPPHLHLPLSPNPCFLIIILIRLFPTSLFIPQ